MGTFLFFAFLGIIASAIYFLFCFIRRLFNYHLFIQIPADLVCGFGIGMIFYYGVIFYASGELRLYLILSFVLGLTASLITFKNFVATFSDFVYNNIRKLIIILKSKFKEGFNDSRKTNKNC